MHRDDKSFTPEEVDEQLDRLLRAKRPFFTKMSAESHLFHQLQRLYKEDERRLDAIWQKYTEKANSLSQVKQPFTLQNYQNERLSSMQYQNPRLAPVHAAKQRVRLLFAGIAAVVIVGSMFLAFTVFRHTNQGKSPAAASTSVSTSATPTGEQSANFYENAGSVRKIDAKTGKILWNVSLSQDTGGLPMLSGSSVYVETYNQLYALDATTGKVRWSHTFASPLFPYPHSNAQPVVSGNILYTSDATEVYAFDTRSGNVLQTYHPVVNGSTIGLLVEENTLYAFGKDDIAALRLPDGTQIWHQQLSPASMQIANRPYAMDGVLFTVATSSESRNASFTLIAAFDEMTGKQLWQSAKISGNAFGFAAASIAGANGVLYAGAADGSVTAYDGRKGTVLWRKEIGAGGVYGGPPLVDAGIIYVALRNAKSQIPTGIIALDASSGAIEWQYPGTTLQYLQQAGIPLSQLFVNQGIIYALTLTKQEIYALNAQGTLLWHVRVH